MADVLWMSVAFLAVSSHLVLSYPSRKCGIPTRYSGKILEVKYSGKNEFNDGEKVMYTCEFGQSYKQGSRSSYCQNGIWSPLELQCQRKLCGSAGEIPNGVFKQTGNAFGDTAQAVCHPGYVLRGEPFRYCRVNGWSGTIPTCVASDVPTSAPDTAANCPLLMESKSVLYHRTKARYAPGDTLSFSCKAGFQLKGVNNVLQCETTGKWSPHLANCQKIKCDRFVISNGKVKFGHLTFNTEVSVSCKDGFRLKGPRVVTCGAHGSWTPVLPTCEQLMPVQVTCPPPAVPNSNRPDESKMDYVVGELAVVSCQKGFQLFGLPQVTCGTDGQWQNVPECRAHSGNCQPPPAVPNAYTEHRNDSKYESNTAVRYKCNYGYHIVRGPSKIYCVNGRWTDVQLICERKKCGSAGELENGRYRYTGALFGDTVTAECNRGYYLLGMGVRNCTIKGWDGREPVCEAMQCPEPPLVPDADIAFDTSGLITHGYMASYRCRSGTLIGASAIVCTEDGTWSAPPPQCIGATCSAPYVRDGVIVSGIRPRYHPGSSLAFKCNPGKRLSGPAVITCEAGGHWKPRLPHCI